MSQKIVGTYLSRLVKNGDVVKEGRGKFRRNTMKAGYQD
jgi:hypothetical protein